MRLLFDIDGTLLRLRNGSGLPPLEKCLREHFGYTGHIPIDSRPVTDFSFVDSLIGPLQPETCRAPLAEFYQHYARCLRESLVAHPPDVVLNAMEILRVARQKGVDCIPFTGNARQPAVEKLKSAGLLDLLDVASGGYGDMSLSKTQILKGILAGGVGDVVVGDAVADVMAAQSYGVPVVAMATGWTPMEILQSQHPNLVLPHFPSSAEWFLETVGNLSESIQRMSAFRLDGMEADGVEEMENYFDSRASIYDAIHLRDDISWGRGIRDLVASCLSDGPADFILDLGAGTGIELEGIFRRFPTAHVRCIDISARMLEILESKYQGKNVEVQKADFRKLSLPTEAFDAVVSVMAFHHLTAHEKHDLYAQIFRTLRGGGVFVNSDYIVDDLAQECRFRVKAESLMSGAGEGFLHIDRPLCEQSERYLLQQTGFSMIQKVFENKKAKILVARK